MQITAVAYRCNGQAADPSARRPFPPLAPGRPSAMPDAMQRGCDHNALVSRGVARSADLDRPPAEQCVQDVGETAQVVLVAAKLDTTSSFRDRGVSCLDGAVMPPARAGKHLLALRGPHRVSLFADAGVRGNGL